MTYSSRLTHEKWNLEDNKFAIEIIKGAGEPEKKSTMTFLKFYEANRKLNDYFAASEDESKNYSDFIKYYASIVSLYEELANEYKNPIKVEYEKCHAE